MRLACVAISSFRIALERQRDPGLACHPLAIGDPPPGSATIIECSAEALAHGIRPGMPLRDARSLCPDIAIVPTDPAACARAYDAMLLALERVTTRIEPAAPGTAYTECVADPLATDVHSAERQAASALIDAVRESTGIIPSAGVASGKFVARVAAEAAAPGEVTVVPPGDEAAFVAPLSTAVLPVSYVAHRKLALYGLRTIADVARMPLGPLQAQFGAEGRRLYELARGIDDDPFIPRPRVEPVTGTLAMPAPTVNAAALAIAARQLTRRLLRRPDMRHRHVRQLRLRLALLGGWSWERTLTFREPLADEAAIVYVLRKLIEPLQLAGPVEEMGLDFLSFSGETGKQRSLLFADQARRRAQLVASLRQLKARFGGEPQVAQVVEVEPWSRIPERRYALIDYDL